MTHDGKVDSSPGMNTHLEIEVKFFLADTQSIRQAILDLGAVSLGRFFEINLRFDDKDKTLLKKKCLLRLRKDQKCRLTFKSPVDDEKPVTASGTKPREQFKIFNEIEIEVDDFDTTTSLLNALGFHAVQRYEKYRETFVLGHTELCIDSMPYGDFLEIEGEKSAIVAIAERLGLVWENRITANYLEIFEKIKEKTNMTFNDLSFDNFDERVKSRVHQVLSVLF